ncbi:MAG: hypothetical protein AB1782_00210 [Cyanobacteriota bacterium]
MLRHSHHHVPAHIGGVRYKPPCCGCGGINRQELRREESRKKAEQRAGLDTLQQNEKMQKKEQIPQHVLEMAGIKLKQQVAVDTVAFAKILQQKGISKEKALEKLLDKLVSMYTSEKELMKALKNMDVNKLMELLKKLLSTVNESSLGKEDSLKKKVEESKDRTKINKKNAEIEEKIEEDLEKEDEKNNKDKKKKKKKVKRKVEKSSKFDYQESANDLFEKIDSEKVSDLTEAETADNLEEEIEIIEEITEVPENSLDEDEQHITNISNIKIEIDESELKFSGNSYSINAVNLLKEQEENELNAIRREILYKDKAKTADNPINKNKEDLLPTEKLKAKTEEKKKIYELEKENEKLRKLILELQQERRSKLIAGLRNSGGGE